MPRGSFLVEQITWRRERNLPNTTDDAAAKRRIWGWFFFDWASQPYATLLLTFIFAPYIASLLGDGSRAQAVWGFGVGLAGVVIALLAPLLGAVADKGGRRIGWVAAFSVLYVLGAAGLWFAAPGDPNLTFVLLSFGLGLIGMELATIFTNAMLPDLGTREQIGRLSGSGWAFGYVGGVLALILMLAFFAEGEGGRTLLGLPPALGLDPAMREGTRFVGPFTALWYVIFMVPFFLWVREPPRAPGRGLPRTATEAMREAMRDLRQTLRRLPGRRSMLAFLLSSMFYRDALNGFYVFGGIYAVGVLGWPVQFVGVFGILAAIFGAVFAWIGGLADSRFGPKPVIVASLLVMIAVGGAVMSISRDSVLGLSIGPGSSVPDMAFFLVGCIIGAAGGMLQSASRTMMVRQAEPGRMTEAFGLYALTGKATAFIAPLAIGFVTAMSGSQQIGILPVIVLFLMGFLLLLWVDPEGERTV
ncbi:MFS transporter [Haematobacter massiliensis]|uniref:MFS transporter n=1 Tax=Haematobacter massiliensis TaxID=195105 RepID=A0A086YA47_9RHOB|nr:MFS transporter [Haematobacter massiliensis]OWJ69682.1 MFS transporter [Haematobacter massiliensis]OWJ88738.1 MFS transporter [Haematobacter massiliensis]QBJ23227.1 MFS transporter [Haematobacter massiliensis]